MRPSIMMTVPGFLVHIFKAFCVCMAIQAYCAFGKQATFEGYKVLDVPVETKEQWQAVMTFISNPNEEYDIWHWPRRMGQSLHVMLAPSQIQTWMDMCDAQGLRCSYRIKDVDMLVEMERSSSKANALSHIRGRHKRSTNNDDVIHRLSGVFATWDQTEDWLLELNRTHHDMLTVLTIGTTHEGRNLYVVRIKGPDTPLTAPAMFVDTGMHAREWISHSSGNYIIEHLIEGYQQSTKIRPLVENMVWYIMPVVNPDGYVFTHETYRFWRKNRALPPPDVRDGPDDTVCTGVDLNRNWGYHWGEVGVSTNSCSYLYPGHEPMSEKETKAMSQFILDRRNIHGYVNIHTYGQLFLTRYGYNNVTPPDHTELLGVAQAIINSINRVHDVEYITGMAPQVLYAYSGGVADWVKGVADVKFSYTTELRDLGQFGFVLPANYVIPVGEEIFAGLTTMAAHVIEWAHNNTETNDVSETGTPKIDDETTTSNILETNTRFPSRYPIHSTRRTVFNTSSSLHVISHWNWVMIVALFTLESFVRHNSFIH